MYLYHVKAKEFGLFKDLDLRLPLGTCFVYAENQDSATALSNGSGKSMLIDVIYYALTGKSFRGYLPENIQEVEVYLTDNFEASQSSLHIVRGPRKLDIYVAGQPDNLKNLDSKQQLLDSLLGEVSKNFLNWKFSGFYALSDRERKELIESIALQRLPDFDQAIATINQEIQQLQATLFDYNVKQSTTTELITNYQRQLQEIALPSDKASLEQQSTYLQQQLQQIDNLIIETQAQLRLFSRAVTCPQCKHQFVPGHEHLTIDAGVLQLTLTQAQQIKQQLQQSIDQVRQQLAQYARYEQLQSELNRLQQQQQVVAVDLAALQHQIDLRQQAKQVLSPEGLRAYITDAYLEQFNKLLLAVSYKMTQNDLVVQLSGRTHLKSGREKSKIQILCNDLPVERYSDGEKRVIGIIIQEAFRIAAPNCLAFYVFDESLSLLDEGRLSSVVDYYQQLQSSTVLVVSQDTDLAVLFKNKIKVTRYNNQSTVTIEV